MLLASLAKKVVINTNLSGTRMFRPHHTAISVRNIDNSLEFYQTFGFEVVHRFDEPDGSLSIVVLKLDDYFLEIFHYTKNSKLEKLSLGYANDIDQLGVKHFALNVGDIQSAFNFSIAKGWLDEGVKIEKSDTGLASWFFVQDPDGIWVEIIEESRYG